jgi:hypothetical protein
MKLLVTVIKSKSKCSGCIETERVVSEVVAEYPQEVEYQVVTDGTPEAQPFGIVTTPVVALGKKIYVMGKPAIKEKVAAWVAKELAALKA